MQTGNKIVDKISTMKLRAVEPTWYKTVVDEKGRTNLLSVVILSDTVYWYTWTEKVDETNNVISYEKKFADKDYVQRNYEQLEDMFNVTRKQVYTALLLLEKIGVIQRVFKSIDTKLGTLHNVMFLSINPEILFDISFPDVKSKKEVPVTVQEHEHLPESNVPSTYKETTPYSKVNTNTATTTVNTTVNTTSSSTQSDDCEKGKKEAASKRKQKRGKTKEELDRINDTKTVMQCFFDNYTKLTGLRYEIKGDVSKYYASSNSFIHKKLASYSASQLCTVLTRYADDPWYKEHAQYELMIILSEKNCIKFLSDTYRPSKTDNGFDVNKVGLVGYVGKKTGDKDEEYYGVRDADVPDVSSVGDIIKRLAEPGVPPVKEI